MVTPKRALEVNRERWDYLVPVHLRSRFYGVEEFKAGKNSLRPIELAEVGDPRGLELLHLQCHFGQDTLSWARLGARATGVDFSPVAVRAAQALSKEIQVPARFICADVYDLPRRLKGSFDIVYTSHGILCWLPDLSRWGKIIARCLRPGGAFHLIESHPFAHLMAQNTQKPALKFGEAYFGNGTPEMYLVRGSYADGKVSKEMPEYEWQHPLSEIISALGGAGLVVEYLHEFPYDGWQSRKWLVQKRDGYWHPRDPKVSLPLMFSIKATKPS